MAQAGAAGAGPQREADRGGPLQELRRHVDALLGAELDEDGAPKAVLRRGGIDVDQLHRRALGEARVRCGGEGRRVERTGEAEEPGGDRREARTKLDGLPGVGPWTVETIALRALGDPDAFPVTDLGIRLAAGESALPTAPTALVRHAAAWRPWRGYAAQHLWAASDHPGRKMPTHDVIATPRMTAPNPAGLPVERTADVS